MTSLSWQYNGIAKWSEIYEWCLDNLNDNWHYTNGFETIYFSNEEAYVLFILRWS